MKLYYVRLVTPVPAKEKMEPVFELCSTPDRGSSYDKYRVDDLELKDGIVWFSRDGEQSFTPVTNVNRARYVLSRKAEAGGAGEEAPRAKGKGKAKS
jgi:hypothetical protein